MTKKILKQMMMAIQLAESIRDQGRFTRNALDAQSNAHHKTLVQFKGSTAGESSKSTHGSMIA